MLFALALPAAPPSPPTTTTPTTAAPSTPTTPSTSKASTSTAEPAPRPGEAAYVLGATALPRAQLAMMDQEGVGLLPFEEPPKPGTRALFFCAGALRAVVLSPASEPFDCEDTNAFYVLGDAGLAPRKVREVEAQASLPNDHVKATRWEAGDVVLRSYRTGLALERGARRTWLVDFGAYVDLEPAVVGVPFVGDVNGDGVVDAIVLAGSARLNPQTKEGGGQQVLLLFVSDKGRHRLAAANALTWDGVLAVP